ncbi:MAG: MarR family transcriptional regulator [Sphingobium sp.]|nr:MarR family transcriptional regulator [Sphingobium sp.]
METNNENAFDVWANRFHQQFDKGSRLEKEFRLTRTIVVTARRWTTYTDGLVRAATGHTRARWQTLSALTFSDGPVGTLDLARRMGLRWPTLIRVLNELETEGLVDRARDETDGRRHLIAITPQGRELVDRVLTILNPARADVLSDFSDEELVAAERVIQRLLTVLIARDG